MILDILLEQYSSYTSFEKMRISGNSKREGCTVCKAIMEGISPGWKMSLSKPRKTQPV
jgi:hypothetical protein